MNVINFTHKTLLSLLVLLISFTLHGQTYLNVVTETTIELTKTNINSLDYLSVTSENWSGSKTYCNVAGDFYNMSSTGRILNIDVSSVQSFDLYVQNSTVGRTFKVTIGSGSEQIISHGGASCEFFSFNTGNSGDVRIKLEGGGSSVYPVKVVLYTAATCTAPQVYKIGGSTVICEGTTVVTLDNSETGVTYALYKDAMLVTDSEKTGDGNVLSWTVSSSGTYTVSTTDGNGYCELAMDGEAIIVIDNSGPEVTSSNLSGDTYSQNDEASALSVTVTGATAYQWYSNSNASNNGGTLIPDAISTSYIPSTIDISTTYYYVVVTGPCGDPVTSNVSGAIVVEVSIDPDVSIFAGGESDWNKTYNGGATNEVIVSYTGASIVSETACGTSGSNLKISESDIHWLEVTLAQESNSNLKKAIFNISGNSGTGSWEVPIFMSDQTPFDPSKIIGYQMITIKGTSESCSDIRTIFPEDVKSFRLYRRAKYTTGDPYGSIGSGENTGSGQTSRVRAMNIFVTAPTGPISDVENISLKGISFDGVTVRNIANKFINVLDMSGRIIISSDQDIDMSIFNKGIYIIRGESSVMKIAVNK